MTSDPSVTLARTPRHREYGLSAGLKERLPGGQKGKIKARSIMCDYCEVRFMGRKVLSSVGCLSHIFKSGKLIKKKLRFLPLFI